MDNWYNIDSENVLKELNTDRLKGLSANEAEERQKQYGLNKFAEKKKESLFLQILGQLKDVAVIILLLAALVGIPPVANFFGFELLDGLHWLISLGLSVLPLMVAEYGKFWDNYKYHTTEKNRVAQQRIE